MNISLRALFKIAVFVHVIYSLIRSDRAGYWSILAVLLILGVEAFKQHFWDSQWLNIIEMVAIAVFIALGMPFEAMFCMIIADFAYYRFYPGFLGVILSIVILRIFSGEYLLLYTMALIIGLLIEIQKNQMTKQDALIDDERRLRYELEIEKHKLLKSQEDIASLTEVKERNRIAREIHDHVGHSIAGVLIQMQLADKLMSKDSKKAHEMIQGCVPRLQETLENIRETVHNLKPLEKSGRQLLDDIIENYAFCRIDFVLEGDMDHLPTSHLNVILAMIKEALTNTSKHSNADKVAIKLSINDSFSRLHIQDNGTLKKSIDSDGMGLRVMRERVDNLNGNLSIDASEGFRIVCILYIKKESNNDANTHS